MAHLCYGILFLFLFVGQRGFAQSAVFDSLSEEDVENIVREFSANLAHTSVTPPTSLGKIFGAEASVIGGVTESPKINEISQREEPTAEVPFIPHAWLLASVSVPYGVSIELNYIPEVTAEGFKMSHTSFGLKWSVTDELFSQLPFDWAVRTYYSQSEIGFSQTRINTPLPGNTSRMEVGYKNSMVGVENLIGFDLTFVEPYVGIGYVQSDAELVGRVTTTVPYSIFDGGGVSRNLTEGSVRFLAGIQVHLTMLKFSLEYSHLFSVGRYSAKLGIAF